MTISNNIDENGAYCWMIYLIGCFTAFITLRLSYMGLATISNYIYHCLDPAPPWSSNFIYTLHFPRHFRKHGRYKTRLRYPIIRLPQLLVGLQLLCFPTSGYTLPPHLSHKLCHQTWDSSAAETFTLSYIDITNSYPAASWDPSSIMQHFTCAATSGRVKEMQLNDDHEWGSTPPRPPFTLHHVSTDDIFPDDHDPSDIVHILKFNTHNPTTHLTRAEAPIFFSLLENPSCYSTSVQHNETPLIVDSGASVCISPIRSDFITYNQSRIKIKDLSSSNTVDGEGLVKWNVIDTSGNQVTLVVPGFHIPQAEVRLLSPQVLLQELGGSYLGTTEKLAFTLGDGHLLDAFYCPRTHLPCLSVAGTRRPFDTQCFWSKAFDFKPTDLSVAYPTLLSSSNTNLTAAQKEVLLWHYKLSHVSIGWLQLLMRDRKWLHALEDQDTPFHRGPFLPCKHKGAVCDITGLKCLACVCAKSHRRPRTNQTRAFDTDNLCSFRQKLNGTKENTLKLGHTSPGDCVSCDHYLSPIPGRLYNSFGREQQGYACGTLFVDHASGKVFNFPQLSTTAQETVTSKHALERHAREEGIVIRGFHSDNGIFASSAFRQDCENQSQKLTYSGVGAHHQNGVAERNIKTISQLARANMLHAAYHWPAHANVKLWPQAVDYATWVFNRLPSTTTGLSPNELWSRSRSTSHDLRRTHPFGCPVYVLDPKLQDGNKIPKWDARARRGMFVGFSKQHSSLVPLCLNLQTGKITPQFHVVFDDTFDTAASLPPHTSLRDTWMSILQFGHDCFFDISEDIRQDPRGMLPSEFVEWFEHNKDIEPILTPAAPDTTPIAPKVVHDDDDDLPLFPNDGPDTRTFHDDPPDDASEGAPDTVPEGVPQTHHDTSAQLRRTRPTRKTGTYKDGPARIRKFPIDGEEYEFINTATAPLLDMPVPMVSCRGLQHSQPLPHKISKQSLLDCYMLQQPWKSYDSRRHGYFLMDFDDPDKVDNIDDARILEVYLSSSKYNEDNPSFDMAVNGPFQAEYWEAMRTELKTIADDFHCWELVPREPHMNVLPSTWAFKVKRYPDGSVKKFKARFCARGDRQQEGIDYFETWAPVVQWSTIRIVMILAAKLGYVSAQCDITAAFIHAFLPPEEIVYVEQPRGFSKQPNHVLCLNRSLYGLKQAPRHFFQYLSDRLLQQGLVQSHFDPCLFMNSNMIVIVYVDDLLIYAKTDMQIDTLISNMKQNDICLRREGTAEGYLGVDITTQHGQIHLTQSGLSKRILAALGLSKYSNSCRTPAEVSPLPKDADGDAASGTINYASAVGMLLYLCGHTRPDLSFAVHQCARYTFAPTKRHERALLRIGHYLQGTADKGLILTPSHELNLNCYPDADFAGLWNHENSDDPHCVRSRTGFVITLANCPVLWASKMQTEIALSTMEAEYIALSTACRDLFPLIDKLVELTTTLSLPFTPGSHMHIRIHEDNAGALVLGKLEPRRMTPRSKHYAVKYHWFREHLSPRNIDLVKISSENQLGDIFTKGLGSVAFTRVRKQLMGW